MSKKIIFLSNPEFIRWVKAPDEELEAFWQNWMKAHPEDIAEMMLARELLLGLSSKSFPADPSLKEDLLVNILKGTRGSISHKSKNQKTVLWFRMNQFRRVAAILIFGIIAARILAQLFVQTPTVEPEEPIVWITKTTNPGEKLKLGLPDQSEVWLNASSRLEYPERFNDTERTVRLSGEAFFVVEPDPKRSFTVETATLTTRVLGTSFNVKEETNGTITKVALLTGSIQIQSRESPNERILVPGEEGVYDAKNSSLEIRGFDQRATAGWMDGWLVFRNSPFGEVLLRLEQWYGVTIAVEGTEQRKWNYSGEFQHETLQNVLESMAFSENFTYQIKDKHVTIKL
ncbi:MAG: FecR domain-containing protein [Lunatimonas sp.]|uniref:FecR family protein n=1 Tax=Lunatimonas sp. TaxID=2060141 RepID=UPI00263AECD1|nr:FecR family protein [Lunatimonas sp.]MCC5936609.1 FecR domain-containing protein [Lunatimonas sp.]